MNSGYIIVSSSFWHYLQKKYVKDDLTPNHEYFYMDSLIVFKKDMIIINEDQFGNRKIDLKLMHYCFADLAKKVYYEFDSLKTNAKCINSYTNKALDSGKGGINFREDKMEGFYPMVFDSAKKKDTVIENIKYQMYYHSMKLAFTDLSGKEQQDNYETTLRWYFRTDLEQTLLRLNREADKEYNAYLVRFETQPELNVTDTVTSISKSIHYRPQKLTAYEEKVILAWAKYADEHPVK